MRVHAVGRHPRRRFTRLVARAAITLVFAVTVSGCVVPAFNPGAYQRNAIQALDSAVSETRTAAIVVDQHLAGRVMRPYADTVVTESEQAMGPIEDSFGTVDPPTQGTARLRDRVGGMLSDAADLLASTRIALRAGDRPAMRRLAHDLRSAADTMERTSESLP